MGQTILCSIFGYLAAFAVCFSVTSEDPYSVKRISDTSFRYEFYTSTKDPAARQHKEYYWFKGGAIHVTQGGYAGELLNEGYKKFYLDNQLAEQGQFSKGLKKGLWKTWHRKGTLATTQYYSNGLPTGMYHSYHENGMLFEKGNYRKGKKHGLWILYDKHDTLNFRNGVAIPLKRKLTKTQKKQINEEKEKAREEKKLRKESESKAKETNVNGSPAANKEEPAQRKGFFKRLFGKSKHDGQGK